MRLYRAIPNYEETLNSHPRAFSTSNNALADICILNEIYSHIMPTYILDTSHQNRIIFSFTDDIDVAYNFTEKHPTIYTKIGYIDIEIQGNTSALLKENSNILLLKPVFRLSDWVDLAIYKTSKTGDTPIVVNNINYASKGIPLINTLVPSRWGALSLAHIAREYAVICKDLVLTKMSYSDIISAKASKHLEDFDLFVSDNNCDIKKIIINSLQKDLEKINISQVRKSYLSKNLKACVR